MNVDIITIGDELLIGQVIDTNSAWMAKELNKYGFSVGRITTVSDTAMSISSALRSAIDHSKVVLITGGIGPTNDDVTKQTLAKYFNSKLVKDERCSAHILSLFADRNIAINELTEQQAWVPECCEALINKMGTAPIMWFEEEGCIIVSMPGVPYEMKDAMSTQILPKLRDRYHLVAVKHCTIWVAGIAESLMQMTLVDFEKRLPQEAQLAYLPAVGIVRLRVTVRSDDEEKSEAIINSARSELKAFFSNNLVGEDELSPSQYAAKKIQERGWTLGTAESCTGGAIAKEITSYPGCSSYYKGSIVCYSNDIKHQLLGVSLEELDKYGAVSQQVVESMARGALRILNCDIALASSGIAGPEGGSPEKPVGTVWIAVATQQNAMSLCLKLGKERLLNIERTTNQIWSLLLKLLEDSSSNQL